VETVVKHTDWERVRGEGEEEVGEVVEVAGEEVVVLEEEAAQAAVVGEGADRVVEVKEGWEACAPVRVRAGSASAPLVTPRHPIRRVSHALTRTARIVESG
jgi:hypothetical protein